MTTYKVAVLVGSLRKASFTRKAARLLMSLAPENLELEEVDISQLPMYNQDFDDSGTPPPAWTEFRDKIRNFDAVLFVTPEYNRSVPAVIKNAIDVGSRPYGFNVWDNKPGAVASVSPGMIGGFAANHHLRQSLVFVNVLTMTQPEAYIHSVGKLFNAEGKLSDPDTRAFLTDFMQKFADWIENISQHD